MPEALFEQTVRSAYESLESYTARSGSGVRFELANVTTRGKESFADLRVIDVATMPEGRVIDVGHSTEATSYPSGERRVDVQYRAEWRTMEAEWRSDPQTVAGIDLPLDEAMVLKAQEDPFFQHVAAVTTYDVTATLGDEARTYRASFYWFRPPGQTGWQDLELLVVDHVTQGVETALRERVPSGGMTAPAPGRAPENSLATKFGCIPGIVASNSFLEQGQGTNSHIAGSHTAGAWFSFTCSCDSGCGQVCSAQVSSPSCADGGLTTDACHKMGYDTAANNAIVYGGGASCDAAFRCVQKACLFCQCGLSVSVEISGGKVTVSGDTGSWAFQRSWKMTCPTCPIDDSDGGGIDDCSGGVVDTTTASLELTPGSDPGATSSSAGLSTKAHHAGHAPGGVVFPLHRVEVREGESFIMEEWAVVSDGAVVATSDAAFGDALVEQGALPANGTRLLVQKPIHVMNARHVHEPGILVNGSGLPRRLQGTGETVAARIEFAPSGRVESVDVLSSSAPVDEVAVGTLLRRRVGVSFVGGKTHRAVAYVVVELTDHIELLSAVSALPQCCCGVDQPRCV